jgi:periplasmic copper chaperone A
MRVGDGLRMAAAVALGTVSVLVGVGPAAAHVTVNPREAAPGGYAKLAFRVPNERDTTSTVKVEVVIPTETAIASVSVRPTPGWTVAVERATLSKPLKVHDSEVTEAVSKITWTATDGVGVQAGQFQEFEISAGPLPEVDRIVFKALQTYSDGEIVRWIEEPMAGGGAEPEHPAPVLTLTRPAGAADTGAGADNANVDLAASSDPDDSGSGWALAAGLAGLVAGLAGLVIGLLAWRRSGRTA